MTVAMTSQQLTVAGLFWAAALVALLDCIKADDWRRLTFGVLTAVFAIAGLLVKPLWDVFPDLSAALLSLVRSPLTWLVLAAVAYLGFRRAKPPLQAPQAAAILDPTMPEAGPADPTRSQPKPRLAAAERERAAEALGAMADFAGTDLMEFYRALNAACVNPQEIIASADGLEVLRAFVADRLENLWNTHSHFLRLIDIDLTPLHNLFAQMTGLLIDVEAARDWPPQAQADRVKPVEQAMSEVGGWVNNLRDWASEKRKEYLE